jgi:hypothetical protein
MLTGRCSGDHKRKEKKNSVIKTGSSNVGGKIQIKTARLQQGIFFFRYWVTLNEKLLKEYFTDNGAPNSSMLPHSSP